MKIILLEDVKKQGKKGDVLSVKDGYGNFLINSKKAVKKTETSTEILNNEIERQKHWEEDEYNRAVLLKSILETKKIVFKVKIGAEGKVFGSISTKQIASELANMGYKIDKKKIEIDGAVNTLGTTIVKVHLNKKVTANLKIELQK